MDRAAFWTIIDAAAAKAKGDSERFLEVVHGQLTKLKPGVLVEFKTTQEAEMDRAYTWDLWGAAYVINGGCSDDGFEYFRAWLMSRGSADWEAALRDADSIAAMKRVEPDECELEELLYSAVEAYEEVADGADIYEKLPERTTPRSEPSGTPWREDGDDLEKRFPKLWKKFAG